MVIGAYCHLLPLVSWEVQIAFAPGSLPAGPYSRCCSDSERRASESVVGRSASMLLDPQAAMGISSLTPGTWRHSSASPKFRSHLPRVLLLLRPWSLLTSVAQGPAGGLCDFTTLSGNHHWLNP